MRQGIALPEAPEGLKLLAAATPWEKVVIPDSQAEAPYKREVSCEWGVLGWGGG